MGILYDSSSRSVTLRKPDVGVGEDFSLQLKFWSTIDTSVLICSPHEKLISYRKEWQFLDRMNLSFYFFIFMDFLFEYLLVYGENYFISNFILK